jgi:cobalt-precorrin 5A hydrolase
MRIAGITLSQQGAEILRVALEGIEADVFVHESVPTEVAGRRFSRVVTLTRDLFSQYRGFVFVAPCGVVVRALEGCCRHKKQDPAVVVVDIGGRYAISLLSGHEGGANDLATQVANALGAEPIITTSSEAAKTLIIGLGCRKGIPAERIVAAVEESVAKLGRTLDSVRVLATADVKKNETGIRETSEQLGIPLRIIDSNEIINSSPPVEASDFVSEKVGLPAVAEPCALLGGRRTRLRLKKTKYEGITVAIAEEHCMWSA